MWNSNRVTRAVLPCAIQAMLVACAAPGGTLREASGACQAQTAMLVNQPQMAACGHRSSVARVASGRPLYTVQESPEPDLVRRELRVEAGILRVVVRKTESVEGRHIDAALVDASADP